MNNRLTERIAVLDGWRGIAILMVLITHSRQWALDGPSFEPSYLLGKHGVGIFFVLSGYLITSNLQSSPIDLNKFYKRRFFRLMPSAWAYLACAAVACIFHNEMPNGNFVGCLLFFRNYIDSPGHLSQLLTGHFWSLSVEEQFYLVWPAVLLLLGIRRATGAAALAFVACSAWVYGHWRVYSSDFRGGHLTEAVAPSLLAGCLLAILFRRKSVREWFARNSRLLFWVALPVYLVHVVKAPVLLLPPSEAVTVAVMLGATIARPFRVLELTPLTYVGRISYSLYVWQGFFLMPHAGWIGIALVIPAGILGHKLIEKPGIAIGTHLVKPPFCPVKTCVDASSVYLYSINSSRVISKSHASDFVRHS